MYQIPTSEAEAALNKTEQLFLQSNEIFLKMMNEFTELNRVFNYIV